MIRSTLVCGHMLDVVVAERGSAIESEVFDRHAQHLSEALRSGLSWTCAVKLPCADGVGGDAEAACDGGLAVLAGDQSVPILAEFADAIPHVADCIRVRGEVLRSERSVAGRIASKYNGYVSSSKAAHERR
jgi:hypothetical protein